MNQTKQECQGSVTKPRHRLDRSDRTLTDCTYWWGKKKKNIICFHQEVDTYLVKILLYYLHVGSTKWVWWSNPFHLESKSIKYIKGVVLSQDVE